MTKTTPKAPKVTLKAGATATTSGGSPEVTEAAAEDLARKVEAVLKPGESLSDLGTGGPAEPGAVTHVEVRSTRPRGRRRAGRSWGPETVRVAIDALSADELKAIESDPALQVTYIAAPADGE